MPNNLITLTHTQYYEGTDGTQLTGDGVQGSYQFIKVSDLINDIVATYCQLDKMLEGTRVSDVTYHTHRAVQELSFDTFRSTRDMEIEIPPSLVMALPHDFVGYTKLVWKDDNGIEHTILPTRITSNPDSYLQDGNHLLTFDSNAPNDTLLAADSDTWQAYKTTSSQNINQGNSRHDDTDIYDDVVGKKFGGSPEHMNINGSFYIDYSRGRIHFSGNLVGKTVTLKYISDGVGNLQSHTGNFEDTPNVQDDFIVHKFAEEACIKHVLYGCMQGRKNADYNMLQILKKEKFAETRKAKIRLSNIKLEEITQVLRGKSKWIKH
tara:strand:+ start:1696 stop:2658 length:963 start_codon:yes stop_codon:yes gene_type:complete